MQSLWNACLRRLENELPAQQFNTWIRPLSAEAAAAESGTLVLCAPNRFILDLVRERFASRIGRLAAEATGRELEVKFVLAPPTAVSPRAAAAPGRIANEQPSHFERSRLNRNFTFDSFVTGKANQLARAAAIQVAENPGTSYNPLFIYGGVGLGKTHLLQAIGNHLAAQREQARVRYTHAEQYVTDVVRAYQQKSFDEFKRYYHSLDLLLIDDIQFFSNKDGTQEQFFYAFNAPSSSRTLERMCCAMKKAMSDETSTASASAFFSTIAARISSSGGSSATVSPQPKREISRSSMPAISLG